MNAFNSYFKINNERIYTRKIDYTLIEESIEKLYDPKVENFLDLKDKKDKKEYLKISTYVKSNLHPHIVKLVTKDD
jgi:hypothetical protein